MADENYERFTDGELRAEYESVETRRRVYDLGTRIILTLLAGPQEWERIGPNAIPEEKAAYLARVIKAAPLSLADSTWMDTQKNVVNTVMETLWAEFKLWAETSGRDDLLVTTLDLLNAALPADQRIRREDLVGNAE